MNRILDYSGKKWRMFVNHSWVYLVLMILPACSTTPTTESMKMAVITKTEGFRHDNIPTAVKLLEDMAIENGWTMVHTEDSLYFSRASLDTLDLVIFLQTTGDIFGDEQKLAIEEFVMNGGGLLTIHSGTVTENSWDWFMDVLGARFTGHPPVQPGKLIIEDRSHPATSFFPDSVWIIEDEWYSFDRNPRSEVHVLISIDESSYGVDNNEWFDGVKQRMGDHPLVWYRHTGKGRVFQTALGHPDALYADPLFIQHIKGAILWTAGWGGDSRVEAVARHHVIFDTDANNEVDDQYALAYLLFSGDHFAVEGVTVNATSDPDGSTTISPVSDHYDEAKRIMQLCGVDGKIPLYVGAQKGFNDIQDDLDNPEFDGYEAVNFIIEQAMRERGRELILLPVGKLTNIALALKKEPRIAEKVRIVWLGSNYPERGEHNQNWDIPAMNYILDVDVPFDMVTVRYGKPSGTSAMMVAKTEVLRRLPGKGPRISEPVTGRHGGEFYTFGDYAVELYNKYQSHMWGDPQGRALFDMAAVAIVKNPGWAENYHHPAPIFTDRQWVERPENPRHITIWEWFDIYAIPADFFHTVNNYVIAQRP